METIVFVKFAVIVRKKSNIMLSNIRYNVLSLCVRVCACVSEIAAINRNDYAVPI